MIIQKSKERAAGKVLGVINQSLAAMVTIAGLVFLIIMIAMSIKLHGFSKITKAWQAIYLGVSIGGLLGGGAWSVLNAFTLKALYLSNEPKKLICLGSINAILVISIPMTVLMVIIAKVECKNSNKVGNEK